MRPFRLTLALSLILCGRGVVFGEQSAEADALWQQAEQAFTAARWDDAIQAYRQIMTEFPESPRVGQAGVRLAQALQSAGRLPEAVSAYDAAITRKLSDYWMQVALFGRGEACLKEGCQTEVRDSIDRLRSEFPESSYTIRVGILEAQLLQQDTTQAEMLWQREQTASGLCEQAKAAAAQKQDETAIQLFEQVARDFPDTAAALRALEMVGHVFIRTAQRGQAAEAFNAILQVVGASSPRSRLVERAKLRVAALNHRAGKRQESLSGFYDLLTNSITPRIVAYATLQAAGLEFELLQRQKLKGAAIEAGRWDALRQSCMAALNAPAATLQERARAELMILETYAWQRLSAPAIELGYRYVETYGAFTKEVATARFVLGDALTAEGRYNEALGHYRWIVAAYRDQDEIWAGTDLVPRAYFRVWEMLHVMHAPAAEIAQAAEALASRFPKASYNEVVRVITRQEQQGYAR